MEVLLVSLLNGLVYGMLLFMLASGLTLIFSMMGVLNFAHASVYMLGAYFAYDISRHVGFWPALVLAPAPVRPDRRADRDVRAAPRAQERPHRRAAVHLRPRLHHREGACRWPGACCPCPTACRPCSTVRCSRSTARNFHAYRGFMLLISALMFVRDLAPADAHAHRPRHPGGAHASRHGRRARPQRAARLHHRVRRRLGAGRPRRRDRRQLPRHRAVDGLHHGADRLRRGGVRRPRLARRLLHRLADHGPRADLRGGVRRLARRPPGAVRDHGDVEPRRSPRS